MTMHDHAAIVQQNGRRWEAMAAHRHGMPVAEHRAGASPLLPEELVLLGDLRGKRVLHLACAVCDEGISMAMAGASVTGIDIAATHIRTGQEKAAALGVQVDLRVGNMMRLDAERDLRDFDLVYISSGGLCWVPDLDAWLVGVRKVLAPGGRLLITEHHPLWEILGVAGERRLTVLRDYFGRRTLPPLLDSSKSAIGTAETTGHADELHSFVWGIGALAAALLRHGFRIAALEELSDPEMYRGLGEAADCIPSVYLMLGELT